MVRDIFIGVGRTKLESKRGKSIFFMSHGRARYRFLEISPPARKTNDPKATQIWPCPIRPLLLLGLNCEIGGSGKVLVKGRHTVNLTIQRTTNVLNGSLL